MGTNCKNYEFQNKMKRPEVSCTVSPEHSKLFIRTERPAQFFHFKIKKTFNMIWILISKLFLRMVTSQNPISNATVTTNCIWPSVERKPGVVYNSTGYSETHLNLSHASFCIPPSNYGLIVWNLQFSLKLFPSLYCQFYGSSGHV